MDTTKEKMGGVAIQGTEGNREDLQKEFHKIIRKDGKASAFEWLAENYDLNPRYARKTALEMSVSIMDDFSKKLIQSSAREFKAQLYAEYRELSDRQKTKRSFEDFVREKVGEMAEGEPSSEEEEIFISEVLRDLGRSDGPAFPGEYRTNYCKQAETTKDVTEKLARINNAVRKIIEKDL